jgi:DNA repair protein RecN (Recombination protein N)
MLRQLSIDNFALIDRAEINFQPGFTVITGETGSGKSILLNALNLILGERADFSVIGKQKEKSIVEADLNLGGFGMQSFFDEHELDYEEQTIIRREISKNGRSRAFINDTPVSLQILKDFTSRLLHIHSQYNTLELKSKDFQLEVLDLLAGIQAKRGVYSHKFLDHKKKVQDLDALEDKLRVLLRNTELNKFQLEELDKLDLDNCDYKSIEEELAIQENADELRTLYEELLVLAGQDSPYFNALSEIKGKLTRKASIQALTSSFSDRLSSLLVELKDLADEADNELERISYDPVELEKNRNSLDEFNRVLFKHKCADQKELMELKNSLGQSIGDVDALEIEIARLQKEIEEEDQALMGLANELHKLRAASIVQVEKTLTDQLESLKLPNTRIEFRLEQSEDLTMTGNSRLAIYFSPNLGIDPVPIEKAASGGELSRVMLSLQYLISQRTRLQTILFDEIDTGVSGDVASRIGDLLKSMGEHMQVIAITHLPQVAAKGTSHLRVVKSTSNGTTNTHVLELNEEERIDEIARLMSGDTITEGARANAKTLMA